MKKRFVFVTLLIAMVALTQIPVSLVRAEDSWLPILSGSDYDPTTFEYQGHTIAEGFAVSASADLPFEVITQIKFGGAVAGLGDPWVESFMGVYIEYTPYVKEMRVRVEGDAPYTALEDTIYDNTGTGGSSWETFPVILEIIGAILNAWQIYAWLSEVYQLPPVAEWDYNGHWSEAIVRQKTEPGYYPFQEWVNPDNPRLQTACANVWGYFYEGSSRNLSVTAQAEIYLQKDSVVTQGIVHEYIGTYEVNFQVSVPVSVNRAPNTPSLTGPNYGYVGRSYTYKACATDPDGDSVKYKFYWGDGYTTTTGYYGSGVEVSRSHSWNSTGTYSVKVKATDVYGAYKYSSSLSVTIYSGGGCPTLFVWNGDEYAEEGILDIHAESDVTVQHWIQSTLALENGVYNVQLRELDEFTSHIDQVKLYAVDGEGEWCLCPLTYAYHNLLGKVKHTLRFDDDNRVDLKPTEIIDLKFGQPIPYSETEYFIFEINGYNLKPLMENK